MNRLWKTKGMISIDGKRLWARHMEMAKIGATAKGGNNRQALTDEDVAGRNLFISWCEEAGCVVRMDEIGNIFARREGKLPDAPPVLTGSHLDTQPTGGRFDGIFGVLAGLEAIETLNDHGIETDHPIEIVVWCNEEGCRFSTSMMGSAVWSGAMSLEAAKALRDPDGISVGEELTRTGHFGPSPAKAFPIKAAIEAHIEQGPILEEKDLTIGIVTGVQNMSRHEISIIGQEAHAGPTPMQTRKDPMRAVAAFLPKLYELCADNGDDARITFGVINAEPASGNTVPGRVFMTMDLRQPDQSVYEAMVEKAYEIVIEACKSANTEVEIKQVFHAPGVVFEEACISAIEASTQALGYPATRMVSGAGHDACNVATAGPTGMIFIPCADGISHNEAESAEPEHITAGGNVLINTLIACAHRD